MSIRKKMMEGMMPVMMKGVSSEEKQEMMLKTELKSMFALHPLVRFLSILLVAQLSAGCMSMMMGQMKEKMFVLRPGSQEVDATVERVKTAVEGLEGWVVMDIYDNQERYREAGDIGPQRVVLACKPKVAVDLLSADDRKRMGSMIPLKIAIYQTAQGVTASWMNIGMMAEMFDGEVRESLLIAAAELDGAMATALE